MLLDPAFAKLLLERQLDGGVLFLHLRKVIANAILKGAIVGDARKEWGRWLCESICEGPRALDKAGSDSLVDHLGDEVVHVTRVRFMSLNRPVLRLVQRTALAHVLVLLPGLLRDVDAFDEADRLVLGKNSVLGDAA